MDEHFISIEEQDNGQRLDRWLKSYIPFTLAQKLIRKGAIRIDGKKVKQDASLQTGQIVRIPPIDDARPKKEPPSLSSQDRAYIQNLVIYDDTDILAINKPHGLASQGGTNIKKHVDYYLQGLKNADGLQPKLIHRLDRETSGVMIFARKPETIRSLAQAFKHRNVKKIYLAIVAPCPLDTEGSIRAGLIKPSGRERMIVDDEEGKSAITEFKILEKASKEAALVAFWPRTGRTHQIRIHAADILKTPVMGDAKYGAEKIEGGLDIANRLHLHAYRLIIDLQDGRQVDIIAPLLDDLMRTWNAFGFSPVLQEDPFEDLD